MKVAVANEQGRISGHFGHCLGFQVYEVEGQTIMGNVFLENPGHKPGFLPQFLSEEGINVIIAGGMGERAQNLFEENNIDVIVGITGELQVAIESFVEGKLESTRSVCREHQHHGSCGEHH